MSQRVKVNSEPCEKGKGLRRKDYTKNRLKRRVVVGKGEAKTNVI